jgi:predicted amidohydrolase
MIAMCIPLITLAALLAGAEPAPDGWTTFSPRDEIAPRFFWKAESIPSHYVLGIAGQGSEAVDGRWVREMNVTAGKRYVFKAGFRAHDIPSLSRSVLARLIWLDGERKQIDQAEYPGPWTLEADPGKESRGSLVDLYDAPPRAAKARIELHLRWAPHGEVLWYPPELEELDKKYHQTVRLCAINHRPRGKTPRENLEQFVPLLAEAAEKKADIVCLGEGITVSGTGKSYVDVAEPIPGPSSEFLGALAKKHRFYLAAGIYERERTAVYNTCVFLGRDGKLLGKYRKVCLPREEIDGGITPGREYPVFDTDLGKVGLMICWDLSYPEVARELSRRGAEVILLPIWGGNETLARARAIENQVYMVASGYDFTTAILDREGKDLARAGEDPQVVISEVDLGRRTYWPWLGDWRSRIWREGPAPATSHSD